MKIIRVILIFLLIGAWGLSHAQEYESAHTKSIELNSDTIWLDSLTIIPSSIIIELPNGNIVDTSQYHVSALHSSIIFTPEFRNNHPIIKCTYSTFPYDLSQPIANKKLEDYLNQFQLDNPAPLIYHSNRNTNEDLFGLSDFTKSGSISRAVSAGNSQNLSIASNLNLQIVGNITPELTLTASITDNNIPIQPDGNTQQLQDFDKVFIQLGHKNGTLIAGDFVATRPKSHFLNYNKKAQGAYADVHFKASNNQGAGQIRSYGGVAISRGKFSRNQISGVEGNQGPYKLYGSNYERYITVLSGTEKVYIDGKLLTRGQNYDYIIDYNTSEITFMPRVFITKDKRINVEFQYSDRNYASYLLMAGIEYQSKKVHLATHYYKESDLKDQPIDQELSEDQKKLLYSIGDSLFLAISPKIDSIAFNTNEILYKKVDSLGFSPVYVYSTNLDSAFYRLSFSLVGVGKGDYIQIKSAANGRVFKWVAPINGVKQGDYAPIVLLVTPKKKSMLSMIGSYDILKNTKIKAEMAMSNNDLNLFSPYDDNDNQVLAYKIGIDNKIKLNRKKTESWNLISSLNYEYVDQNFEGIERYRTVEFSRDWSIQSYDRKELHLFDLGVKLEHKSQGYISYEFNTLLLDQTYSGLRNRLKGNLNLEKQWHIDFDGSITESNNNVQNTRFVRHHINLSKGFKYLRLGFEELSDDNRFTDLSNDSLTNQSFSFQELQVYVENEDTLKNKFRLHYKWRDDKSKSKNTLKTATTANEAGVSIALLKSRRNKLKVSFSYRQLAINDSTLTSNKKDETGLGQLDHNLRLWKGGLIATTFYQIGSVLEVEKEFSYVEVAAGQGVYSWTDYNNNGIKELDEFEIAAFADQANYIRVYIPGTAFIKSYGNIFSTSIMLNPARFWRRSNKKIQSTLSHFANQLVYRASHKTLSNNAWEILNPFYNNPNDPQLISLNSNFRNTFYFNRTHPKYGADLSYRSTRMKVLMTNGFESKNLDEWQIKLRWNFSKKWQINLKGVQGDKRSSSEYFKNRDYDIYYYDLESRLVFQPNKYLRISAIYGYGNKQNEIAEFETLNGNRIGLTAKHNLLNKGIVNGSIQFINNNYNGLTNGPVAFEMMQGLQSGENYTWNLSYQRTILKNLQLSVSYNGRKPANTDIIHVGSIQLRAFF